MMLVVSISKSCLNWRSFQKPLYCLTYLDNLPHNCLSIITFFSFADSQEALVFISEADIHAVAGTLKQYFRELPDPLFTAQLYPQFTEALGTVIVLVQHTVHMR